MARSSWGVLLKTHGVSDEDGKQAIGMKYSEYLMKLIAREVAKMRLRHPERNSDSALNQGNKKLETEARRAAFVQALDAGPFPPDLLQRHSQVWEDTLKEVSIRWSGVKHDMGQGRRSEVVDPDPLVREFLAGKAKPGKPGVAKKKSLSVAKGKTSTKRARDSVMEDELDELLKDASSMQAVDSEVVPSKQRRTHRAITDDEEDEDNGNRVPASKPVHIKREIETKQHPKSDDRDDEIAIETKRQNTLDGQDDGITIELWLPASITSDIEPVLCVGMVKVPKSATTSLQALAAALANDLNPFEVQFGSSKATHAVVFWPTSSSQARPIESENALRLVRSDDTKNSIVRLVFCKRSLTMALLTHLASNRGGD